MLPQPIQIDHANRPWRVLIYGGSGSGKTTTAGTVIAHPALSPALLINIDLGEISLPDTQEVMQVFGRDMRTFSRIVDEFRKPRAQRSTDYRNFKTIIIDSVSSAKEHFLDQATLAANKKRPTWDQWGEMQSMIVSAYDVFAQSDMHLVLTAGSEEVIADGRLVGIKPEMNAALWKALRYRTDYMWYTFTLGLDNYRLQVLPNDKPHTIKTRNKDFADNLAAYNLKRNSEFILKTYGQDHLAKIPQETLKTVTIADDETLGRLYGLYRSMFAEEN